MNHIETSESFYTSQLVARIRNGDRLAEQQLIEHYRRGLSLVIHRQTTADIAKDVLQETWRVAIENIRNGALREPEKLASYLVQVGRNQVIMYYRRHKNSGVNGDNHPEEEDHQGPLELLEAEQTQHMARHLLKELAVARDREILYRYYLQEEEKEHICRDMNLTDLHFNRVIHRAKQRLRQIAESYGL
ncbi:MAG TPA: sigma-70 family RNA polymerase sigma factor [Cellvibrio sp.]|nr:sigma-70 family RNA polymerase sigma factor [Cellvibrio sp.]